MNSVVIALDCGSHAVRSLAIDVVTGEAWTCAVHDIPLLFPRPGWVEVDPEVLASASLRAVRAASVWAEHHGRDVVALGLANMRETAFAWSRSTGVSLCPAVMWMSQQSSTTVQRWREQGLDTLIRQGTGLSNDAFFFGSKLAWMLEHRQSVGEAAQAKDLAVGTVDSWLLYYLTGGQVHRTDTSNASRTQLLDLSSVAWSQPLCDALGVPRDCLPELTNTMGHFGVTDAAVVGREIPITGVVADQQASLLGHGCEDVGDLKATFGTSGVVSLNTGVDRPLYEGMVTSVAWTDPSGITTYEVEGSAFHSGYTVGWLAERTGQSLDGDVEPPGRGVAAGERVYVLPSFTVLGAPRWPAGRGAAITGLGMDTTTDDLVRAGIEAMAFQAFDLCQAMGDALAPTEEVNVDGGGASSNYLCQLVADLLQRDVVRPSTRELTSIGAAVAAMRGIGLQVEPYFGQERSVAERFTPRAGQTYARDGYEHWVHLVETILR